MYRYKMEVARRTTPERPTDRPTERLNDFGGAVGGRSTGNDRLSGRAVADRVAPAMGSRRTELWKTSLRLFIFVHLISNQPLTNAEV